MCASKMINGSSQEVSTIFFDVGYTLIYPSPDYYGACERIAKSQGLLISESVMRDGVAKAMSYYHEKTIEDTSVWVDDTKIQRLFVGVFGQIFFHCLTCAGYVSPEKQSQYLGVLVIEKYHSKNYWNIFDDVVPVLTYLRKKGYILGVYSDWWSELPELLKQMGLSEYFKYLYSSSELGIAKRQDGSFRKLIQTANLQPSQTVMVGDSIELDIVPAQSAGIRSIWVNRDYKEKPDFINSINSLGEIIHFF